MPQEISITQPEDVPSLRAQNEPRLSRSLNQLWHRLQTGIYARWQAFQRLPRRVRIATASVALVVIAGLAFSVVSSNSAKLNIRCQHTFQSAELSVWIDNDLVFAVNVSGSAKNPLTSLLNRRPQGLAKIINVPSGRHTVRVRLNANSEGYDQIKTVAAVFSPDQDNALSISAGRRGLYVSEQRGRNIPAESDEPSSYKTYASSVVLSILASGMSAAIAFIVQEFMRAQKARLAASNLLTQAKP
jgi:hypothetical protein